MVELPVSMVPGLRWLMASSELESPQLSMTLNILIKCHYVNIELPRNDRLTASRRRCFFETFNAVRISKHRPFG